VAEHFYLFYKFDKASVFKYGNFNIVLELLLGQFNMAGYALAKDTAVAVFIKQK